MAFHKRGLPWLILAAVYVLCVMASADFLTWHTLRLQLIQAAFIGLVAIGETLVILIGKIVLSIPWTITLSAILATNVCAAHSLSMRCLSPLRLRSGSPSA